MDETTWILHDEQWRAFTDALEVRVRDMPKLVRLLSRATPFDSEV